MNSPKVVVSLGIILICSVLLTACGGGGGSKTPPPPAGPPTIQTATLSSGAINAPYLNPNGSSVSLFATGGTGTYTWSISSGSLPPGLSLNGQTGVISGTPTAIQSNGYPFTAKVTDAASMSDTANLNIYIQGVVSITPAALPSGSVGVPYSQTLTASGGLAPYTWCVLAGSTCDPTQASLPAGLSLNAASGVISGTPTTNGPPTTFTVQVTDSETSPGHPTSGVSNFTITIMSITTASLPNGYINTPYNVTLTESGGSKPWTWCVVEKSGACDSGAGSLPSGLTLSAAGVLSGTPTQTGSPFPVTVRVTDGEKPNPAVTTANFSFSVYQSQLIINTTTLPPGQEGVAYNATLTASGGVQPYTWSITSGSLPPGLSLDPATCTNSSAPCVISGTPTTVGPSNFTVQVKDSGSPQQPASAPLSILINFSPVTITTTSLPAGNVGVPYSTTLMASGGLKPYTWCIFEKDGITCDNGAGILPAGLTLNQGTGLISGTPTSPGTSSFNVQVQDSGTPQQTVKSLAPLSIVITSLDNSTLNGNYVFNFSGYNNGTPVFMAGSFVADGKGGLTSGVLDYNDGNGEPGGSTPVPQNIVPAKSSYSIQPNGLGTMTVATDLPATYNFSIAIRNDGSGRLIQSDPANQQAYGSGAIMSTTPINQGDQWPLCGSPVAVGLFGVDSSSPPARYAAAGQFQFSPPPPKGTCVDAENGTMDVDDGGTPSSATFTGAFNQFNSNTSRGITGFTYNGDQNHRYFYAFYLVSSSDHKQNSLVLVSENVCPMMGNCTGANPTLWSGLQQANPPAGFNNSYLAGGTAVAELNALDTNGAVDVTAGLVVGQGASGHTCTSGQNGSPQFDPATFSYDENQGGTSSLQQTSTGTYCVDKTTGRVTLTPFNAGPFATPPVFYLVKTNQGFVVGTDPAVTSGYFEPQTASSFGDSSLFGLYAGGTIAPVTTNVTNSVTSLVADGGGNITGNENTSGPGGPQQPPPFTYTYTVDNTGRALVCASGACNAQSTDIIGVAYVVSPTKFVLLPATDPNPALSIIGQ